MVEVGTMNNARKYAPTAAQSSETVSFGAHRQLDRPASALRAGASSMPAAWQTRGGPSSYETSQHGAPARTVVDIAMDPLRWTVSTKVHKIASATVLTALVLNLIF